MDKPLWARLETLGALWRSRVIPIALLVFLTAPFWVSSRAALKTVTYILVLLPALPLLLDIKYMMRSVSRCPLALLLGFFLLYMAASSWWAVAPATDIDYFKVMFMVGLLLYAFGLNLQLDQQRFWLFLLVAAGACAIGSIVSLANAEKLLDNGRLIAYNIGINPLLSGNLYAAYLLFLVGWLGSGPASLKRCVAAAAIATPILWFVIATGSRSPLLGLLFALAVIALVAAERRARYLACAVVAIGPLLVLVMPELLLERGLSLRPEIWRGALAMTLDDFWFGHGAGSPFAMLVTSVGIEVYDTHNIFIAILYYGGVTAGLLWVVIFFTLAWQLVQRRSSWLAIWVLGYMVYGATTLTFEGSGLLSRPNEFWYQLWLPIALALFVVSRSDSPAAQQAASVS